MERQEFLLSDKDLSIILRALYQKNMESWRDYRQSMLQSTEEQAREDIVDSYEAFIMLGGDLDAWSESVREANDEFLYESK